MRPRAANRLSAEPLEDRTAPTAADLTAGEQYLLELVNRARANTAAEPARYGIDQSARAYAHGARLMAHKDAERFRAWQAWTSPRNMFP